MMINKIGKITEASRVLYGEPLSTAIAEKAEPGEKDVTIPFSFLYNSSWRVDHGCANCGAVASFGLHYDPRVSPFPQTNYVQLKNLCSKYFKETFLESFPRVFTNTELKQWEGALFVISDNVFDQRFPVISSIAPICYNCPACNAAFTARIGVGHLQEPEKDMPMGLLGEIVVREIVQVSVAGNKTIPDLAAEYSAGAK